MNTNKENVTKFIWPCSPLSESPTTGQFPISCSEPKSHLIVFFSACGLIYAIFSSFWVNFPPHPPPILKILGPVRDCAVLLMFVYLKLIWKTIHLIYFMLSPPPPKFDKLLTQSAPAHFARFSCLKLSRKNDDFCPSPRFENSWQSARSRRYLVFEVDLEKFLFPIIFENICPGWAYADVSTFIPDKDLERFRFDMLHVFFLLPPSLNSLNCGFCTCPSRSLDFYVCN